MDEGHPPPQGAGVFGLDQVVSLGSQPAAPPTLSLCGLVWDGGHPRNAALIPKPAILP